MEEGELVRKENVRSSPGDKKARRVFQKARGKASFKDEEVHNNGEY